MTPQQKLADALRDYSQHEAAGRVAVWSELVAVVERAGWRPPTAPDPVPRPDLSRLAEMDGYLDELATETGDDGPLTFWREIRRSINAPLRAWLESHGHGGEQP